MNSSAPPNNSPSFNPSNFGVKKELHRPFQEILGCLSLLYHLNEKSTFARIDELLRLNVFCAEGAENLKKAINQVLSLRLQVHLFYKDEKEFLCHPEEGKPQDPTLYYFSEQNLECLHEIYKVLLPFHKCASEFYRTKDKSTLNQSIFCDGSPHVKAITFEKTLQYAKAHEAYQQAVLKNLITCAKKASPSQAKTLQEVSMHCRKLLGEDPLVQQLTQLVDLNDSTHRTSLSVKALT